MASPLRFTAFAGSNGRPGWPAVAEEAWAAVVSRFEVAEQALSRFRPSSDLTQLNATAGGGEGRAVSRTLERALVAADRAWRVTGGRFDPRVLTDLERLGERGAPLPSPADPTRSRPDDRPVRCDARHRLRVDRQIDLGGIGKGLALRWAANDLARIWPGGYLLDAGGDIVTRGPGPDAGRWLVGVEDPLEQVDMLAAVALVDGAIATSSIRRRQWDHDGRRVHHLIDPRTGEPAAGGLLAVVVVGPDPAWAEVWSKSLFIGGGGAIAAAARRRGLAAWWVTDDGTLEMTAAARIRTVWTSVEDGP